MKDKKGRYIYGVYRGDVFVMTGTFNELSEHLPLTKRTLRFYTTKTRQNRCPHGYIIFKLEEDEDE